MKKSLTETKAARKANNRRTRRQCLISGVVDDVTIEQLTCTIPYPNCYIYRFYVRAHVTLPSPSWYVASIAAKVWKGSVMVIGPVSMTPTGSGWYTTSQLMLSGCRPGDVICAEVNASVTCSESGNGSVPAALPQCG